MQENNIIIKTVVADFFMENAYILHVNGRNDSVIIDPGLAPDQYLQAFEEQQLEPAAILNTHGHGDHTAGNGPLVERWPDCPIIIGEEDAYKLTDPVANLSQGFGFSLISPEADVLVADGDELEIAGIKFEVRHIPGHSIGHVAYICRDVEPWLVFGGDLLFQEGIGRYDFPDGDQRALVLGIKEKLYTLPDDTLVYPGHGAPTTIGHEKLYNPFVSTRDD